MGNLVRAITNIPRANWHELDASTTGVPNQNPALQPWGQFNTSQNAERVSNTLEFVGAGASLFDAGGWAYEHQPYTSYWGLEFEANPSLNNTLQAQFFGGFLDYNWSRAQNPADLADTQGITLFHNSPLLTGGEYNRVQVKLYGAGGLETVVAAADLPGGNAWFNSATWHHIKMWVDGDQDIRIWVDGTLRIYCRLPAGNTLGPAQRTLNFCNRLYNDTSIRAFKLYDRDPDLLWSSSFYDDFNRANSATVGNGWTKIGTNAGIVSNSYATTGTTDGHRAILRDTGITNGRIRVEATLGGAIAPSATAGCGLIACSNSAGTQGLAGNAFSDKLYISRYSTVLSGNPPTWTDLAVRTSLPRALVSGDVIGFSVRDGAAWIDVGGEPWLAVGDVHAVVPATNPWAGVRVSRATFANSASLNDCRILAAA